MNTLSNRYKIQNDRFFTCLKIYIRSLKDQKFAVVPLQADSIPTISLWVCYNWHVHVSMSCLHKSTFHVVQQARVSSSSTWHHVACSDAKPSGGSSKDLWIHYSGFTNVKVHHLQHPRHNVMLNHTQCISLTCISLGVTRPEAVSPLLIRAHEVDVKRLSWAVPCCANNQSVQQTTEVIFMRLPFEANLARGQKSQAALVNCLEPWKNTR